MAVLDTRCAAVLSVLLQEGEPQGRHVVIVDDLVQSGGTLIECHALLSSLGAKHGRQPTTGHNHFTGCCRKVLIQVSGVPLAAGISRHTVLCQVVCQVFLLLRDAATPCTSVFSSRARHAGRLLHPWKNKLALC